MREIVKADYPMTGRRVSRDEAIEAFRDNPYKVEIAREIPEGEPITLYTIGDFTDLCRGGHADSTGAIGAVKLQSVAGAYWRGKEHNPMLQRIYGTAFTTQQELDDYLTFLEEAAKRDHRKLGAELDLYHVDEDRGRRPHLLASQGRARCAASSSSSFATACASAAIIPSSRRTSCTRTSTQRRAISRTSPTGCSARSKSRGSASGSSR